MSRTGSVRVIKNWKGKMATVRKSSVVWPTAVNCKDVVKSACKNDAYIYCVWRFCALSRCNDSDTAVDSIHTVVTEPTLSPLTPKFGRTTPNLL